MPQRPGGNVQCRVLGGVCSRSARRAARRLLLSSATVQLRELHGASCFRLFLRVPPQLRNPHNYPLFVSFSFRIMASVGLDPMAFLLVELRLHVWSFVLHSLRTRLATIERLRQISGISPGRLCWLVRTFCLLPAGQPLLYLMLFCETRCGLPCSQWGLSELSDPPGCVVRSVW